MSSPTYCYERLARPREQIRLLTVKPTRDYGSVIEATMSTYENPDRNASRRVRLSSHLHFPPYWAISYVWGTGADLERTHSIIVDGRQLFLTANLYVALLEFRSNSTCSSRFWIDAICINQADDEEKSAQIPLMPDVYHLAMGMTIWLGKGNSESDQALRFIRDLCQSPIINKLEDATIQLADVETDTKNKGRCKRNLLKSIRSESKRALFSGLEKGLAAVLRKMQIAVDVAWNMSKEDMDDEEYEGRAALLEDDPEAELAKIMLFSPSSKALQIVKDKDFQEMGRLLEKSLILETQYFNRMWTLQEACVSFNVGIQCGKIEVDFDDFLSTVFYLRQTKAVSMASTEKLMRLQMINLQWTYGQRLSLRRLLYCCYDRESKDPRDKIYAVEGLMRGRPNSLLKPDYSKPIAEVYANAARSIIATEKDLDLCCGHQWQGRFEGLPSWTPDFRYFGQDTGALPLVDPNNPEALYFASLEEPPVPVEPENPEVAPQAWQILTVTGLCLGAISHISQSSDQGEKFGLTEKKWRNTLGDSDVVTHEELGVLENIGQIVEIFNEFYHDSDRASFWARNPNVLGNLRILTGKAYNQSQSAIDLHNRYLLTLLCGRTTVDKIVRCGASDLELLMTRACIPDAAGIEALETICKALDDGMRCRRLAITDSDFYRLGVVPENTLIGDLVYVLMGNSVPVVLRKIAGLEEFMFVGECYFHGVMDGEAIALRDEGKLLSRTIALR